MKTINIRNITSKGLKLDLNSNEDWLVETLYNAMGAKSVDLDSIGGQIDLHKTNQIVNFIGEIKFIHHPACARCGTELTVPQKVSLHAVLAPLYHSQGERKRHDKEEEIELTKDDVDFSYYENDEIRIDSILNDEIALAMPYNFYCADNSACQANVPKNEKITINDDIDPRWQALKDLKSPKR